MRILLVDDEHDAVEALQRAMLPLGDPAWVVEVAHGADEAVNMLGGASYDLLVTDLCMPGHSGGWLLDHVHLNYPGVIRVALSGLPSRDVPPAELRRAHQFLAKPCRSETLAAMIRRTRLLRELLADAGVARLVASIDALPPTPQAYGQIKALLADDNVAMAKVAALIARDPAIASKVLQLVNSAFYQGGAPITNLQTATCRLGTRSLEQVVLAADVSAWAREIPASTGLDPVQVSLRALRAAEIARDLSRALGSDDDAATAALLLDLGLLVLAVAAPAEIERAALGYGGGSGGRINTDYLGAFLLCMWGVPDSVVQAVAFHREPWRVEPHRIGSVSIAHAAIAIARGQQPSFLRLGRERRDVLVAACRPLLVSRAA